MSKSSAWLLGAAILLLACADWQARAQAPVLTQPGQANSGEASGTIASSNVFQLLWASTANPLSSGSSGHRNGCIVLNTSAHTQWVYFQGPGMTTPTAGNSSTLEASAFPLDPPTGSNKQGGSISCATGAGQTLQDSVWITGTSGDTYVAKQQ